MAMALLLPQGLSFPVLLSPIRLWAACLPNATAFNAAMLYSLSGPKSSPLPSLQQDLATFLLTRGDFAWIGYQWVGCVDCSTAVRVPPAPKGLCDPVAARGDPHGMYARPAALDADYGIPKDGAQCRETAAGSGVFERQWTKAKISFDCGDWSAEIEPLL